MLTYEDYLKRIATALETIAHEQTEKNRLLRKLDDMSFENQRLYQEQVAMQRELLRPLKGKKDARH